jgi:peptide/nickel transport system ATP-binding protein
MSAGRTLGVVGESGSGKSMLAKSIMRLLPREATVSAQSRVRFDGTDLCTLDARALRGRWGADMAMVFQDPMTALTPVVRVGRQLAEPLRAHRGLGSGEARLRSIELLRQVGIPEPERCITRYPHELSGGMRQRVLIAIALSCQPKLLVADEPTTALDVTVQQQILNLLGRAQHERSMAMMLITHDLGVAAGRTDEIAVMYGGRIVERAPTRRLFATVRHPYTAALMGSVPRSTTVSHTRLEAIPGRPPVLIGEPTPGCTFAPRCRLAQRRCLDETPALVPAPDSADHEHACFFPIGTPAGDLALATNTATGMTAAGLRLRGGRH